nr:MAG TPA: hypothetical protein [Caudoviricetes sp.]
MWKVLFMQCRNSGYQATVKKDIILYLFPLFIWRL